MQIYISWVLVGLFLCCILLQALFGRKLKSSVAVVLILVQVAAFVYWYWSRTPSHLESGAALILTLAALATSARTLSKTFEKVRLRSQAWSDFRNLLLGGLLFLSLQMLIEMVGVEAIDYILASLMLFFSLIVLFKIVTTLTKKPILAETNVQDLPTVTLAIPARNEDAVLEKALNEHLKSLYPKLEIIVLDDCSQDTTAQVIKSFAHQGVRFIGGLLPETSWLGKNHAYQQLLDSASGKLILFCGADVSLEPASITELVNYFERAQATMLSVLPHYSSIGKSWLETARQISRYYWQIGLSGMLRPSPVVVGSCWLVEREALNSIGGFSAVKRMIEPERYIAKQIAALGTYIFVPSHRLKQPIQATKLAQDQIHHFLRAIYPWLHHSILASLLTSLGLLYFAFFPVVFGVLGLLGFIPTNLWLTMLGAGLASWTAYLLLYLYVAPKQMAQSILSMPFMLGQLAFLTIWSALLYEFRGVEWKGRSIHDFAYDEVLLGTAKDRSTTSDNSVHG